MKTDLNNDVLKKRMRLAGTSLTCFSVLTAVNFVLMMSGSSFVFPLSAFLPQYLLSFGQYASDMLGNGFHSVFFTALSLFYVTILILSSLLSFRHRTFLFPSLILLIADTAFMTVHFAMNFELFVTTNLIGMIIHVAFHIVCVAYAFLGVCAYIRFKNNVS